MKVYDLKTKQKRVPKSFMIVCESEEEKQFVLSMLEEAVKKGYLEKVQQ